MRNSPRSAVKSNTWEARSVCVYFYRLDTPGFRSVKKAVVTR